jgi:hypothetical protein
MNAAPLHPVANLILAGMLVLSACSKEKTPEAAQASTGTSHASKSAGLTDIPEGERQELDAFGKKLEAALRAKDTVAIVTKFHLPGMVERIMDGVNASGSGVDSFKGGLAQGLGEGLEGIAKSWAHTEAKYKHPVVHQEMVKLRFRIASDSTVITMLDVLVKKRPDGTLGIVDFYNHAMGQGMAEQGRLAALPTLMELDKGILERLLGTSTSDSKAADFRQTADMVRRVQARDFQGA